MEITMKLANQLWLFFLFFQPFHYNSRFVVDEDGNGQFGPERVKGADGKGLQIFHDITDFVCVSGASQTEHVVRLSSSGQLVLSQALSHSPRLSGHSPTWPFLISYYLMITWKKRR